MGIRRIEELHFGVEEIGECIRFFEDFGLGDHETTETGIVYRTPVGQGLFLHEASTPGLPPAYEEGSTIREVIWGVGDQDQLKALGENLASDREITVDDHGTVHTHDENGYGIGFRVASDTGAELWHRDSNASGNINRWSQPLQRLGRAHPFRMCHVAYHIPQENWERAVAFYTDRLGFRITDQLLDMGTFMQAADDQDQHTILLGHRADRKGINHIAYEVANFDEVVEGGNHMVACGWKEARRLGRHTIGSNVFRFFHAPCGGRVEYAADMDRADENYGPNVYAERPPHHMWMLTTNGQKEEL
jgi:catechol 2,3-dioxygenase-like lactoylglutathione lyase family enzyme